MAQVRVRRPEKLAGIVCRGVMTLALAPKETKNPARLIRSSSTFANRALAKRIIEDSHDKIFITYGARHLSVCLISETTRPTWKVATVKWMRTIEAPKRSLEGKLSTVHDSDRATTTQ